MGFKQLNWVWSVRGVSSSEQVTLAYMTDLADAHGNIPALSHKGIQRHTARALSYERIRKIIAILHKKTFIKDKAPRTKGTGEQISNRYQLDYTCMHPPEPTGMAYWQWLCSTLAKLEPSLAGGIKYHGEMSDAFYDPESGGTLTVWVESIKDKNFFKYQCWSAMRGIDRDRERFHPPANLPKVRIYELMHLGSEAKEI